MASLPSFVELMASLGLEQGTQAPAAEQLPSPPQPPSSPGSPQPASSMAPTRSTSSPSLREMATRHHISRFTPYSPAVSFTKRRGSLSSVSSSSSYESSPLSATFPTRPTPTRPRRYRNKLTVNTYESSSDLNADTPISTYVRRKTPATSPTSPTFNPADSGYESSSPTPMPFSIPSLPVFLPHSASSESNTPTSEVDHSDNSPPTISKPLADITEGTNYYRFIRRRTETRISTPPRPAPHHSQHSRRKQIFDVAS